MGSCLSADGWGGRPQPHNQAALPGGASAGSPGGYRRNRSVTRRKNQYPNPYTGRGDAYDEISSKVSGRMFANGASNVASLFTQQGRKGINQDAMIVWEDFGSRKDTIFCGVFDGHGPFGHLVARRVRDSLPLKLLSQWQASVTDDGNVRDDDENASLHFEESVVSPADNNGRESFYGEEKGKHPEVFHTLKETFTKAFKVMDKDLRVHPTIDCFCSGTTAVTLIKQGQDLVIGNIGDSRAVVATRIDDNCISAVQLTRDLKPNLPQEAERIRKCKGRVFALHDEPEVARVWLPNNDSPGLAMARAFGDFCLKEFGLISVPEVSYRRLTEKDEFIVLATDGIWDVLSNKEAVDIVAAQPSRSNAAKALVQYAVRSWRSKYPTSRVDDCAVVCLFLNNPPADEQIPREITYVTSVDSHGNKQNDGKSDLEANSFYFERKSVRNMTNSMDAPDDSGCYVKIQSQDKVYHVDACDQDSWFAVESVTRVNSLINIPRNEGASNIEGLSKCF